MADLSEFADDQAWRGKSSLPKGWEPSLDWRGDRGTVTTGPLTHEPDDAIWANLIADWGLDPSQVQVVAGSVQVRAWDVNVGGGQIERLKYYRASIEPTVKTEDQADIDELLRIVEKRKPTKPVTVTEGRSLVVLLSDWQVGKCEPKGGGTPEFLERLGHTIDRLVDHAKRLHKHTPLEQIVLVGMGDLVEGCAEFYSNQTWSVDADRRTQSRIVRHQLLAIVERLLPLGVVIQLAAVPGNHGENRRGGKAFTNIATDNDDLAVFEQVAEILAANPERYGHVHVPLGAIADDLTLTLDISGVPVSFAHGHQITRGTAENWWKGQALGRTGVADAQVLITAHKHNFQASEQTGRFWVQCPALDGGSEWWTSTTGQSSPAGMLSLVIGNAASRRGWSDLVIL